MEKIPTDVKIALLDDELETIDPNDIVFPENLLVFDETQTQLDDDARTTIEFSDKSTGEIFTLKRNMTEGDLLELVILVSALVDDLPLLHTVYKRVVK